MVKKMKKNFKSGLTISVIIISILACIVLASNIQWEDISPEDIGDFSPEEIQMDMLSTDQLAQLNEDQIRYHIDTISTDQMRHMDSSTIDRLGEQDALDYFSDRLSSGYMPQNENEVKLLKKITSFSNVDVESFMDINNGEFGEGERGDYVSTPFGTVYLNAPHEVVSTMEGLVVDNTVRLTDGSVTAGENHISLGLGSSADLLLDGSDTGVSVESGFEMPTISNINDEADIFYDSDTLFAGWGGYTLIPEEDNIFTGFVAEPSADSAINVEFPLQDGRVRIDSQTVSYIINNPEGGTDLVGEGRREGLSLLPFEEQKYITDSGTIVSEDGGTTFEVDGEGEGFFTGLYHKISEKVEGFFSGDGGLYTDLEVEAGDFDNGMRAIDIRNADDDTLRSLVDRIDNLDSNVQTMVRREAFHRFPDEDLLD